MDRFSQALGLAIRQLRDARGENQAWLAKEAGYEGKGKSGVVSISRIENGKMPTVNRLRRIARALGVTEEELLSRARELEDEAPSRSRVDLASVLLGPQSRANQRRASLLQENIQERSEAYTQHVDAYQDAARLTETNTLSPLIESTKRFPDLPALADLETTGATGLSAEEFAAAQLRFAQEAVGSAFRRFATGARGFGAGGVAGAGAAWAAYSATAMWGTASTGAAIAGLSGAAASNAILAALGGGALAAGGLGITGGIAILGTLVAAPAILLTGATVAFTARKTAPAQSERLRAAEDELNRTQDAFDTTIDALARATKQLGLVGLHGARIVEKWVRQTEPYQLWDEVPNHLQKSHQAMTTMASHAVLLMTLPLADLFTLEEPDHLLDLKSRLEQILRNAEQFIEKLL